MYTLQVHAYGYQSFIYYYPQMQNVSDLQKPLADLSHNIRTFPLKNTIGMTCKRTYLFANLQSILVTDLFCFEFIVTFFNSKKQTKNCNTHCFISFKSHKKCSSSVLLLVNCL